MQVPDVNGQASADAIATLQNQGFKIRTQQKPDSNVPPDHVIDTDPTANTRRRAGDEITINVSTGPEQREIPDVANLSYADAVRKLDRRGLRARSSSPRRRRRPSRRTGSSAPIRRPTRRRQSPT